MKTQRIIFLTRFQIESFFFTIRDTEKRDNINGKMCQIHSIIPSIRFNKIFHFHTKYIGALIRVLAQCSSGITLEFSNLQPGR